MVDTNIYISDGMFILSPVSCPKGGTWGVLMGQKLNSARPTVMVSPPKPLDQIQPNLVCELLT